MNEKKAKMLRKILFGNSWPVAPEYVQGDEGCIKHAIGSLKAMYRKIKNEYKEDKRNGVYSRGNKRSTLPR